MASLKHQAHYEGLGARALEILHLLAQGLSDREIAERLVMTVNTVKWYNRQIYNVLEVSGRTQAIARAHELQLLEMDNGKSVPFQSYSSLPKPKHNLPAENTHFIGRKREIEEGKRLLYTTRLLTLVGPPGTGKTRLALQIVRSLVPVFPDGVYLVALASVNDPALVMNAIANALGVSEQPATTLMMTLKQVLCESRMLLVLDNFEHILAAAPHLKVLATSREPLHLYGEQEYFVPPLELPDPEHPELQSLEKCESIALFLQRARAARPDFSLTPENSLDVAKICVRLEGLPLAIELAAARIKLLTPQTLLSRLSKRLDMLVGGAHDLPDRQQTLHNTIDWSYNLLNQSEKVLFARLSVFHGGCSLEAIQSIFEGDLSVNVLDSLESLINKSLLQQKELPGGEPRFTMLETLHEYACERLEESGEAGEMCRRHAAYFVELAEHAEPQLRQTQQQYWFHLLDIEHENVRAVLQWSLSGGDITLGVRLAGALSLFWFACGYHVKGRSWTQQLLDRLDNVPVVYHSKLLFGAGHMAYLYNLETAKRHFERALQISRELGDTVNIAWSLTFLGYAMMREMDSTVAITEQGLSLFRELNYKPGIAQALNIIGEITCYNGDNDRALQAYKECLAVSQETGETRRIRFMYGNLGFLAQRAGDYEYARELAEKGLRLAVEMNNALDIADSLACIAGIMGLTGRPEQAARLLGAWEAALERMGAVVQPADQPDHNRSIAAARAQLSPVTFETAWAQGRTMSLEQAVAYAFECNNL